MQSHHKNIFFDKINFCDDFYSNIIKIQNMIFLYIYTCESLINIIKEKIIKKLSFTKQEQEGMQREVDPTSNKLSYTLGYKEKNNSTGKNRGTH